MAKFVSFLLVLYVLLLAALAGVIFTQNTELQSLELMVCSITQVRVIEMLGAAFGLGVVFGWLTVCVKNLRRRQQQAETAAAAEESVPTQEFLDGSVDEI